MVAVLAAFAVLVLYLTFSNGSGREQEFVADQPRQVEQEPYLSAMSDLEGNQVDMEKDKLVFLNVWATWCGPCVMEMPGIQSLYERYKENDKVRFYIVSDEDAETIVPFITKKGYKLPFYIYADRYPGVLDGNAIPRSYIIYKGKILAQVVGAAHWDTPETYELIEKALGES